MALVCLEIEYLRRSTHIDARAVFLPVESIQPRAARRGSTDGPKRSNESDFDSAEGLGR